MLFSIFKLLFQVLTSGSVWILFVFVVFAYGIYALYCRTYFTFKRIKVGGTRTALVTGGSCGTGLSFAKLCVEDEYNVIIVARNMKKLEKAKSTLEELSKKSSVTQKIYAWSIDLGDANATNKVMKKLEEENLTVDILINNAAFGDISLFEHKGEEFMTSMMNTNMLAVTALCKRILPGMITRKYGRILNVGSLGAFFPSAFCSVYSATKSYLRSFSLGVAYELRRKHKNVTMTCLHPGGIQTDFQKVVLEKRGVKNPDKVVSKMREGFPVQTPDEVAFEGYRAMMKCEYEVISGHLNWLMVDVIKFLPFAVYMKMFYTVWENSVKDK